MFGEAADFGLSPGFERTDMEGILGLGLPQEGQALPLFHNGYKQGVLPSHSFAMYLGGAQDKDNFLSLGGYDPKYNISEFNKLKVIDRNQLNKDYLIMNMEMIGMDPT